MVLVVDLAARRRGPGCSSPGCAASPSTSEPFGVALEVDPEAAHRVVHGGEDAHRVLVRVLADELLVDLEDAGELLAEHLARQVRHVEVDLVLVLAALRVEDAAPLVEALLEELAAGDVARDEVAVAGVLLLEEVVAVALGDVAPGRAAPSASCGTQTRPPSPRTLSEMRRSLSAPGMAVGWTWMNSPFA